MWVNSISGNLGTTEKMTVRFEARSIVFHVGKILSPQDVTWEQQTVSRWYAKALSGIADPCRIAADNADVDLASALFLVPVPMGDTAGYAWPGGPALVATVEIHGDTNDYLHTVAHEIGHAYYYWDHPWQDEDPPLKYSDNPADQKEIRARVSEHRLRSIMSYPIFGSQNDFGLDAPANERAYVACYQRAEWKWVDEDCELPNPRPGQVNAPRLTPGNGLLVVSMGSPNQQCRWGCALRCAISPRRRRGLARLATVGHA